MKRSFSPKTVAWSLLILLLMSSCTRKQDETYFIPKDAVVVMGINLRQIASKVNMDTLRKSRVYQDMMTNSPDSTLNALMKDPSSLGVDLTGEVYAFIQHDSRFGNGYMAAVAPLADRQKFEAYLKSEHPSEAIKTEGGLGHLYLNGENMIGWSDHVVMAFSKLPKDEDQDNNNADNNTPDNTQATFENVFHQLSQQGRSGSVASLSNFGGSGSDLFFWLNMAQLYQHLSNNPHFAAVSAALKPDLYTDSYVLGETNFGQDRITVDVHAYLNDKMADLMKRISSTGLDPDLIRRIPSNSPLAVLALSINPRGIKSFLNALGVEGLADEALSEKSGLGLDTALMAFKGDLIVALLPPPAATPSDSSSKIIPDWVAALTVGDTASMAKVLDLIASFNVITKTGPMAYQLSPSMNGENMFLSTTPKLIVGASSSALGNQFLSGSESGPNAEITGVFQGKNSGFYMDVPGLISLFGNHFGHGAHNGMSAVVKSMYGTSTPIHGNVGSSNLTIQFMNGNKNSLEQLIEASIGGFGHRHFQASADSTATGQ